MSIENPENSDSRQLTKEEFELLPDFKNCGLKFGDRVQSKAFYELQGTIIGAQQENGILSVLLDNGKSYYPDMVEKI